MCIFGNNGCGGCRNGCDRWNTRCGGCNNGCDGSSNNSCSGTHMGLPYLRLTESDNRLELS